MNILITDLVFVVKPIGIPSNQRFIELIDESVDDLEVKGKKTDKGDFVNGYEVSFKIAELCHECCKEFTGLQFDFFVMIKDQPPLYQFEFADHTFTDTSEMPVLTIKDRETSMPLAHFKPELRLRESFKENKIPSPKKIKPTKARK